MIEVSKVSIFPICHTAFYENVVIGRKMNNVEGF